MSQQIKLQKIRAILADETLGYVSKLKAIEKVAGRSRGFYKTDGSKIADVKAYMRTRYERLKAAGICTNCGESKSRPGRIMCSICAKRQRMLKLARYHNIETTQDTTPTPTTTTTLVLMRVVAGIQDTTPTPTNTTP